MIMLTQEKLAKISLLILELEGVKEWEETQMDMLQASLERVSETLIIIKEKLQEKAGILT